MLREERRKEDNKDEEVITRKTVRHEALFQNIRLSKMWEFLFLLFSILLPLEH